MSLPVEPGIQLGLFNECIGLWDVRNVTNMQSMFRLATNFDQPLNGWDVQNVTNMEAMFHNAENFDQPLNGWDVRNVTNMKKMFCNAKSFNQPLDKWMIDDSKVEITDMFKGCPVNIKEIKKPVIVGKPKKKLKKNKQ
tara:strand:- start:291 stop:704 length:414 start_codon:yes stop_codon:yes gene_type:complete